jgi:hypothetical protein
MTITATKRSVATMPSTCLIYVSLPTAIAMVSCMPRLTTKSQAADVAPHRRGVQIPKAAIQLVYASPLLSIPSGRLSEFMFWAG